jgi:hypothetical protein
MRESEQNRSTFVRRNLFKVSILYLAAKHLFILTLCCSLSTQYNNWTTQFPLISTFNKLVETTLLQFRIYFIYTHS